MATTDSHDTLRIAVLSGGDSAEREVSLRSGAAVAAALKTAGHTVSVIDPAACDFDEIVWSRFDLCFIALHGGAGEDGRVQAELARRGVPYTGSDPQACRLAMSKRASKERFVSFDVPTPAYVVIAANDSSTEVATKVESLGYPLIVKPDGQGSSVGLAVVDAPMGLTAALAEARKFDSLVIAEPFVRGREFTVALVDDRPLPLVEIVSPGPVFSYEAKYQSALAEYRFDFELADTARVEILHAAVGAAHAVGSSGLSRVDLILDHQARVWVLEINTIPGMTPRSLAPQAALRAGIDMPALCDLLVRQCLSPTGVS